MGREYVTDRSVLLPVRQAHGEGHLAPGDRQRVLAGRVKMADPIAYTVWRIPELTEKGMLRERLGIHRRRAELFREGLGCAHHLYPLARDVEVRVTDGPLLADFEQIRIAIGPQGLGHARPDLLDRLPGSEGRSVHEVDDLPGREVLGEQPPPLASLGYPFIRQGDVSPVRSDLTVPYPMDPHGGQQSYSPHLTRFRSGRTRGQGRSLPSRTCRRERRTEPAAVDLSGSRDPQSAGCPRPGTRHARRTRPPSSRAAGPRALRRSHSRRISASSRRSTWQPPLSGRATP